MRRLLFYAALVAGCGRFGFAPVNGTEPGDAVAGDPYAAMVLADGAIAYWRLDETSGTTAYDVLGHYDGQYQGGCTLGAPGALASGDPAALFDGSSCQVVVGDVLELAGATPFTVELWANIAVLDGSVRWFVSHNTGEPPSGYTFACQGSNVWFEQDDGAALSIAYVNATVPAVGAFHYYVYTNDTQTQTLYIDGAQVNQLQLAPVQPTDTGVLQFGAYLAADQTKFAGTLDEIAFYGRALDAATIAAHFATR